MSHVKEENLDVETTNTQDFKCSFKGSPFQILKIQGHLMLP